MKTYAYLLCTCDRSEARSFDWSEWSGLDIFEILIESEEQAESKEDLWNSDWEGFMDRIAPVQLTCEWDPRPALIEFFRQYQINPLYQADCFGKDEIGLVLYFDKLPEIESLSKSANSNPLLQDATGNTVDKTRFEEILIRTISLAHLQNRGMLFIGEWEAGQAYDEGDKYLEDQIEILRDAGMEFFTRTAYSKTEGSLCPQNNNRTDKGGVDEAQEQCINHLKELSVLTVMYTIDNDDTFPDATKWCDQIMTYNHGKEDCLECPVSNLPYAYAMNTKLSGVRLNSIVNPERTVLYYESDLDVRNAHDNGESIPKECRHPNGHNVVFASSDVEVIRPEQLGLLKWTID